MSDIAEHRPLRCRTGHHAWIEAGKVDGDVHRLCTRCGAEEYEPAPTMSDPANLGGNLAQGFGANG